MTTMKRSLTLVLAFASIVLVAVAVMALLAPASFAGKGARSDTASNPSFGRETSDASTPLTGEELVNSLGLELKPDFDSAKPCSYFTEVSESGAGYCLDAAADSLGERFRIAYAIRGVVLSQADVDAFVRQDQAAEASTLG